MTKGQRIALQAEWWPAACRSQGWRVSDRLLRLRVCSWAVSLDNPSQLDILNALESGAEPKRSLSTTTDLNSRRDMDRVKACLLMLADDVNGAGEVGHAEIGSARRKRNVIMGHVKCLKLFEAHPRRYLAALVADLFNHGRPGLVIRDLRDEPAMRANGSAGPSDLDRLVMRLAAVVNAKRNANVLAPAWRRFQRQEPLTIHEMKVLAGAICDCRLCQQKRRSEPQRAERFEDCEPALVAAGDDPF